MPALPRTPALLVPLVAALTLALAGCPPSDVDGDGYTIEDDCDDDNAAVHPGADEVCDGRDNDCDGTIDETDAVDATTWFSDVDGDGYGDGVDSVTACAQPPGRVLSGTDCDDLEALANPGDVEATCDGIDNDCDPATVDAPDGDGDGSTVCDDCDDDDDTVSPDLAETTCNGVDDDCDASTVDEPDGDGDTFSLCLDCDDADPAINPGVAYDDCDAVDSDCNTFVDDGDADGDGHDACLDCDESDAAVNPAATELCDGINNDCDADTDEADADDALTWYEDTDGDLQGDDASSQVACYQPTGWVLSDEDCDDGDDTVYLGADEVCAGGDENCNGLVDDGCTTVEHCGTISADETWGAMEVHHVTCNVSVEGASSPTLTIEDWTTVTFAPDVGLYVGNYNSGELQVPGTGWVTFTSDDDTPSPGDWRGLYFGSADTGSELAGATIEYGGSNAQGNMHMYYADVDVIDSISRFAAGHGLYANGDSELLIQGSSFTDNDLDGVHLDGPGSLEGTSDPSFSGNTLTGNDGFAMSLPANSVGELDATSTFAGNDDDAIRIDGDVTADAVWQALDAPLLVTANVSIEGSSNPELTVEDGATVLFEDGTGLYVGNYNTGTLYVDGATSGVVFSAWDDTPSPGDWLGVYFGSADGGSDVLGLDVSYGGGNGYGNLTFYYADGAVTDSTVSWSSTWGIYRTSGNPTLTGIVYSDNASGDLY